MPFKWLKSLCFAYKFLGADFFSGFGRYFCFSLLTPEGTGDEVTDILAMINLGMAFYERKRCCSAPSSLKVPHGDIRGMIPPVVVGM
ncbi:hypothetical protein [Sporomusa acidovorans]|uniref:hypothetical protein n=1 Tax=Sporomusa acidovorans TaxID=112900 RepID=UPI001160C9F0|nr:hypothetical protein [Sporomusa acidovorans]